MIAKFNYMVSIKISNAVKLRIAVMLIISVVFLASSCTSKMHFSTSTVVPAAKGLVKVKKDKNNNYSIQLQVTNLAEAERLTPPKKVYVVWMVTKEKHTKNIGQLVSSSGMFSKSLKASLKTVSSFKPKSFFVTAEDDGNVQRPGTPVLLVTQ